jgi:hypothetical protein
MSRSRPEIDIHPNSLAANALKARTSNVVVIGVGPAGTGTAARFVRGGLTALPFPNLLVENVLTGLVYLPKPSFVRIYISI